MMNRIEDGPVATVYSGHHNGVPVALKVFPKRFDKRTMSAFTKEQNRLATVRRVTSILMVDGVTESPSGEPALRMELCTQSLTGLVERVGPLAASDVAVLGRAMALALAAAHSAGVVHGGISPNNVLFRTTGEPVVGDFGVTLRHAFIRDPLHAIEYLPPETLREGTLNESTDLYGLGAVLHFALTARSPHPGRLGEQPGERVLRILGEPIPAINRPDIPVQVSTLVARLLSTTADKRPPSATQVAEQLTTLLPNPPKPQPQESWDDFDTPAPTPASPPTPPHPHLPDDFDDFAPQYRKPPSHHPPPAHQPRPTTNGTPTGPDRTPGHPVQLAGRSAQPPAPTSQIPAIQPLPPHPPAQPKPEITLSPEPGPIPAEPTASPKPDARPAEDLGAPPRPTATAEQAESAAPAASGVPTPSDQPDRSNEPVLAAEQSEDTPAKPADRPGNQPAVVVEQSGFVGLSGSSQPGTSSGSPVQADLSGRVGDQPAVVAEQSGFVGLSGSSQPGASSGSPVQADPSGRPGNQPAAAAQQSGFAGPSTSGPPTSRDPSRHNQPTVLPLASLAPAPSDHDGVLRPDATPTDLLPTPATVEFAAQHRPGVVVSRPGPDPDDDFTDFAEPFPMSTSAPAPAPARGRGKAKVLAGPLAPPDRSSKRLIRYDLLAGAALLLALLALVPLLLLRSDPEEMSSSPRLPPAGASGAGDVTIELAEPIDLTDKVQLTWTANRDLDFVVAVAAEGEKAKTVFAERNHSMTVDVKPGVRYCFQVQASDGGDEVYESEPVGLRGATCRNN